MEAELPPGSPEEKCREVVKKGGKPVARKSCHQVPQENCREVVKKGGKQSCHQVPEENCRDIVKKGC